MLETGLAGKTVLITGASRNMGRMSALAFAREGANLAICTSKKIDELNQVATEARALGVKVHAGQCDVTDAKAVADFVGAAHAKLGSVDVAINLAGFRAERKFLEEDLETWNRTVAVNLTGPFLICRSVVPLMQARRWGRIINVSGIAPFIGHGVAKAAVKLGIVGLTRGLAREFGEYNITANCIGPGAIERSVDPEVTHKPLRSQQPIPRKGTPDEAISLLIYLASENAGFITGQCYLMNGGMYFQ